MICMFCEKSLRPTNYDWGYMIVENEQVLYAHLDCIVWDMTMERLETEEYLAEVLSF